MGEGWSSWTSLGGVLTSSPAAASPVSGQISVAVRGGNGALYIKNTTNGGATWSSWSSLGGQLLGGTGPAMCALDGELDLFVTGLNGAIYSSHWNNTTSWTAWTSLGGYVTSSPAAVAFAWGTPHKFIWVAARGGNGALYSKSGDNGGATWPRWFNWGSYGGQLLEGTGPASIYWFTPSTYGALYFVTGTDHQLYLRNNSGWQSLGGYLTSGPAAASYASTADVFVVGSDGDIWSKNTTNMGTNWNPWYEVPW